MQLSCHLLCRSVYFSCMHYVAYLPDCWSLGQAPNHQSGCRYLRQNCEGRDILCCFPSQSLASLCHALCCRRYCMCSTHTRRALFYCICCCQLLDCITRFANWPCNSMLLLLTVSCLQLPRALLSQLLVGNQLFLSSDFWACL